MRILLSNDDGYQARGLRTLADGLAELAEVTIVAPDRNRSGASNSLTLDAPLRVEQAEANVYYVNGTPTDCVHVAMTGLLADEPDMVISGINHGANLGDDVLYSGTVAAAMEGRFLGLPALAVSLVLGDGENFGTAVSLIRQLVRRMKHDPLPGDTILNINVPTCLSALSEVFAPRGLALGTNPRQLSRQAIRRVRRSIGSDRQEKRRMSVPVPIFMRLPTVLSLSRR